MTTTHWLFRWLISISIYDPTNAKLFTRQMKANCVCVLSLCDMCMRNLVLSSYQQFDVIRFNRFILLSHSLSWKRVITLSFVYLLSQCFMQNYLWYLCSLKTLCWKSIKSIIIVDLIHLSFWSLFAIVARGWAKWPKLIR